jgi:AcrR family transcriptional regulator
MYVAHWDHGMTSGNVKREGDIGERIVAAAVELASRTPIDEITLSELARATGLSRPTVRRYAGNLSALRAQLRTQVKDAPVAEDARQRLLTAASKVFARLGYHGASVDAIAAEAGLTKGAVYWHFKSKDELLQALMKQKAQQWIEQSPLLVQNMGHLTTQQVLVRLMEYHLQALRSDPDWSRLYFECMTQNKHAKARAELNESMRKLRDVRVGMIRYSQSSNRLSPAIDADTMAVLWAALTDGLTLAWMLDPERFDDKKTAEKVIDLLWQGLAPRE